LDGVEGLVHISELAQHHVENPREIIQPGDPVRVKILEIDSERRRLSLSIKRVEGQVLPVRPIVPPAEGDGENEGGDLDNVPELGLSEDVFADPMEPAGAGSIGDSAGADSPSEAASDASAEATRTPAPAREEQGPDPSAQSSGQAGAEISMDPAIAASFETAASEQAAASEPADSPVPPAEPEPEPEPEPEVAPDDSAP
ncbi:MAG: S1 RNA-binding domain-containing protein, partial [Actinomycetota bacterium]|nr:S1 RNA-binding domain-containing protein [Actinomycetota bacterium]